MRGDTLQAISENDNRYAKLTVPTRSDGAEINFSTVGVGDMFSVSSSSGSIKENNFTKYVTRLEISPQQIEIGIIYDEGDLTDYFLRTPIWVVTDFIEAKSLSDVLQAFVQPSGPGMYAKRGKEPDRHFRVQTDAITEVRIEETTNQITNRPTRKLTFETSDDVFEIAFSAWSKSLSSESAQKEVSSIELSKIEYMIEKNMSKEKTPEVQSEDSETDIASDLSELQRMYEDGLLTDEEFKSAKQKLLK